MANNTNKKEATGFTFTGTSAQAVTGRTIPGSQELISTCNTLALDAIKLASTDPEIGALAAAVQSGDHEALVAFVDRAVEVPDKSMLDGATEDELSRLLESRRSDRSKAKKAGLTTLDTIRRYISAWIAELVIRAASGKAYKAPSTGFSVEAMDGADRDAITRKIKSLQSKKCRLNQAFKTIVAAGIDSPEIKQQLDEVEAEIKRLNAMRGTTVRVKTTDAVPSTEQLRAALAGMSADELKALLEEAAG
jgi:hypothetical protein